MEKEIKICKHHFEAVKEKFQEWKKNYTKDGNYDYGTIESERTYIFCIKCGEIHTLTKENNKDK